jgi:hypothetical protein
MPPDQILKFTIVDEVSHDKYIFTEPFACTINFPKDFPMPSHENLLAQVTLIKNWYKSGEQDQS